MDATHKYKLDVIISLLFLLLLIESYRVAGYFGAAFVVVVTVILVLPGPD
ncbi:hypothetical protein [Haloferax denitrificans]|nr:hypothetical protein [Haloferax denitrificans]